MTELLEDVTMYRCIVGKREKALEPSKAHKSSNESLEKQEHIVFDDRITIHS